MKRACILGLLGALALTLTASGATVTSVDGYGQWQTGLGGEFTFAQTGLSTAAYVSGETSDIYQSGTFQTFCVDPTVFYAGTTYNVQISDPQTWTGNQLTAGAAWLYYAFATGQLFNNYYGYTHSQAGALQDAIWNFMNIEGPPAANIWNTYANNALATMSPAAQANAANGIFTFGNLTYQVDILQLYTGNGPSTDPAGAAQNQLYLTVPDGGSSAMLLGFGLTAVGCVRRRIK